MRSTLLLAAAALALVACSARGGDESEPSATESAEAANDDSALTDAADESPTARTAVPGQGSRLLTLEGLGDLVVGEPIPANSNFSERGAQIGDDCRTINSPDYPGVYAMTEGKSGPVRRITLGQRSDVKLVEGIGVGASEAEVLAAFPGFRSSPHKYADAPAKYLTQPGNDPRLRFEIGEDGRVSQIHVGLMPQLEYVEGCA